MRGLHVLARVPKEEPPLHCGGERGVQRPVGLMHRAAAQAPPEHGVQVTLDRRRREPGQQAPAPVPGTPQASSTAAATINPVFAGREHAVQEAQVAATATQAAAQAAAEQAQQAAALATADATPQAMAQASQQTAQTTATAEVSAPSTRAAVEVMAAALTQQNAQAAAQQAALAARLDALVTQQAQIATQLSLVVAGLASASGLLSQQLTQQLEETAQGAAAMQDNMAGAGSALAGQLNFIGSGGDPAALDQFLSTSLSSP